MKKRHVLNRKSLGQDGETLACNYLRKKGYKIIARNYRCKIGEIDIIARHKRTLIFCEVKTRNSREFGEPFEAVNKPKQDRLRYLAQSYLQSKYYDRDFHKNLDYRFDVVSIILEPDTHSGITHLENAF